MRGYYDDKQEILGRLRRVEGQIRGLQRMVENDDYCIDILTQITAASNALKKVAVGLLDDHIRHCVMEGSEDGRDMVREATLAIERLVKS
ncbi:MAG TPA: metal-sensitive transcriptional regulator [Actinomycetota bacterium]|nr:metal-sensitive transcriptional regulator [Actinomycetota bacterium]